MTRFYRTMAILVCTLMAILAAGLGPAAPAAAAQPGPVVGWGRGNEGQLGSPGGQTVTPRAAGGAAGDGVTFIAAGRNHSLALKADGTLYAFGSNGSGALGTDNAKFESVTTPTQVAGLTGVTHVAAGGLHSLAVAGGAVYAWGYNESDVNGPNSTKSACTGSGSSNCDRAPVAVGLTGIKAVGAGYLHSMAIGTDGRVYAWGRNSSGQLGRAGAGGPTPTLVAGIDNVTDIDGGEDHTLALRADGTVWAWGRNSTGQLGLGAADSTNHTAPAQVPGLSGIVAIAAGYRHSMALGSDGTLYTWGQNDEGELGHGEIATNACRCVGTPTAVPGLSGIRAIGAGESHSLAVRNDGAVFGFGLNANTQVGVATPDKVTTPTQIPGVSDAAMVTGGVSHSLALRAVATPTFTLTVTPSGSGTVALSPPGGRYAQGTQVTLTPQAQGDAIFTGWTVDGQAAGHAPTLTLTMDKDHTVLALFGKPVAFCDVNPGDLYAEAIRQLSARGVIRGFEREDGKLCFGADDNTKRAQMAALIARPLGWDAESHGNGFSDQGSVDANLWRNVGTLAHYQVAKGYRPETCAALGVAAPCYGPTDNVLHAQVISFITRGMVAKGYWQAQPDNPALYPNIPADSGHRIDIATYVHYAGALPGTSGTAAPWAAWDQPSTRGWFAEALWRSLDAYFTLDRTP